jgi:hypothetical protein
MQHRLKPCGIQRRSVGHRAARRGEAGPRLPRLTPPAAGRATTSLSVLGVRVRRACPLIGLSSGLPCLINQTRSILARLGGAVEVSHGGWTRQVAIGDRPGQDPGSYVRSAMPAPAGNTGGTSWPPESGTLNVMGAACTNPGQAAQARRTMAITTSARRDSASYMFVSCARRFGPMASRNMDGGNNHVRPRRRPRHKFGKVGRKSRPAARSVAPLSFWSRRWNYGPAPSIPFGSRPFPSPQSPPISRTGK